MTERVITIHFKFEERVLQLNTSQNLEGALDVQDEELAISHSNGIIRVRPEDILYISEEKADLTDSQPTTGKGNTSRVSYDENTGMWTCNIYS